MRRPLWVLSRHFAMQNSCPLYPRKRTSCDRSVVGSPPIIALIGAKSRSRLPGALFVLGWCHQLRSL